jgi:uncharacterized protein YjbJ (UPF0337 family)
MNTCLIKGACLYSMGFAQEVYGAVVGNNELRMYGNQMKICGKFELMIGEAQTLIARCIEQKEAKQKAAATANLPSAEIIQIGEKSKALLKRPFPLPRLVAGLSKTIRQRVTIH